MFSTTAPANTNFFSNRCLIVFCLTALSLIVTPQLLVAQTSESSEDPPPFMYDPTSAPTDRTGAESFICRRSFDSTTGGMFCADQVNFGATTRINASAESTMRTFVLDTHESVTIETRGNLDTFGQLLDANGRLIANNDDSGNRDNFKISRTLAPGRYYVDVNAPANATGNATGNATLHIKKKQLVQGSRPVDLSQDIGNHCGRAAEISTFSTTASAFDRQGDIDVYAIEMAEAGQLLIDIDGAARYELKASDCTTSLGLTSSSLGATLAPLPQGTYYLYLSQMSGSSQDYELNIELR